MKRLATTFANRMNASWEWRRVIYKKGASDNFVWEEIKVGAPERGQVRLRSTAVSVIEELGPGVTGFSVGERVCTCLPPLGSYSQERFYPADKLIKVRKLSNYTQETR